MLSIKERGKNFTPAEYALTEIRDAIIRREFEPGCKLTEATLCKKLGVGRSSVRSALRTLSEDGYVELFLNKSAHVVQFTKAQISQIYAIRGELISYALRIAIDIYTPDDYKALECFLAYQLEAFEKRDFPAYISAVSDFFLYIINKAGNPYLTEMFSTLSSRISIYLTLYDNFYSVTKLKSIAFYKKTLNVIRLGQIKKAERIQQQLAQSIIDSYELMTSSAANK